LRRLRYRPRVTKIAADREPAGRRRLRQPSCRDSRRYDLPVRDCLRNQGSGFLGPQMDFA
jgi:hypothetical protein